MSLAKVGLNLAQKTAAWLKNTGKTSILQTKPIKPGDLSQVLHYSPNLACDTIQLSKTSYLSDSFVKSLTQIKGKDSFDTSKQIINSILKKMGYKHPENLNVEIDSLEFMTAKNWDMLQDLVLYKEAYIYLRRLSTYQLNGKYLCFITNLTIWISLLNYIKPSGKNNFEIC